LSLNPLAKNCQYKLFFLRFLKKKRSPFISL